MSTLMAFDFNFGEKIGQFFTLIPKVVYFLFACLTSALDAMQNLIRKLAGLDTYYVSGNAQTGDPLKEFVYGILGIGDGKAAYAALHTVFISLIIFGVIVLVVSTMVAIIKSHYKEDTQGTDPWKYIYQAIKAILTALVVPVVVVLGFFLTNFLLTTLDSITAGTATSEQITTIYGSSAPDSLKHETIKIGNGTIDTYINYDYFGARGPTNTTTFSGLLFKASAYSANRARLSDIGTDITIGGLVFGDTSAPAANDFKNSAGVIDRKEFVAYQIDYAFQNNLAFNDSVSYTSIQDATGVNVYENVDLIGKLVSYDSFSKYYVALVWQFYDLWQFNFIVAFCGVFALFTILLSIVMGLMSRLIKGAAYFLVYPAILGIAPLDEFKAFKSWSSEFIKTMLMAIGSIVGINLVLLLLPYLQLIKFFDNNLLDYIINIVLIVVAISMAKDIISMVNNFVGGADAVGAGDKAKGSLGEIKKSASLTAKVGLGVARAGVAGAVGVGKGVGKLTAKKRADWRKGRQGDLDAKKEENNGKAVFAIMHRNEDIDSYMSALSSNKPSEQKRLKKLEGIKADAEQEYRNINKGKMSDKELEEGAKQAGYDAVAKNISKRKDGDLSKQIKDTDKIISKADKATNKADSNKEHLQAIVKNNHLTEGVDGYRKMTTAERKAAAEAKGETYNTFGEKIAGFFKNGADNIAKAIKDSSVGKSIADSFLKTVGEVNGNLGTDKAVKSISDVLKGALTFKGGIYDTKPKLAGDDLAKANADAAKKSAEEQKRAQEETNRLLKESLEQQKKTANATTTTANKASSGNSTTNNNKTN